MTASFRSWSGVWPLLLGLATATGCATHEMADSGAQPDGAKPRAAAASNERELIARKLLFGNPDKTAPRLSPDGKRLSYLAEVNGVLNVWVGPVDKPDAATPVTKDDKRGIRQYFWAYNNEQIIYLQDKGGDENWRVYVADVATQQTRDLTPFDNVQARVQQLSQHFPDEILVALNNRNPQVHDIHRVNLRTGATALLYENPGAAQISTDAQFRVRYAMNITADGGLEFLKADAGGALKTFAQASQADSMTTAIVGLSDDGKTAYWYDSRGRDTSALLAVDTASEKSTVLAASDEVDVDDVAVHPGTEAPQAVAFDRLRKEWKVLDKSVERDFAYLKKVSKGDLSILSRTLDDQHWLVAFEMDAGPQRFYHYDRAAGSARFLFTDRAQLEGKNLARMHPTAIKARDGLSLVSYLSLPWWTDRDGNGRPSKPLPMVLLVHGGPWGRDDWGYFSLHQWLANRGYAVLSVNFRGSTGFGKKFINAADKQWAAAMHDDLIDAVDWAVRQRVADGQRVAIMGGSYGGYATLVGLTFTPEKFACGVDIVGPSNLITLLESIPPYWTPLLNMFTSRVGDHRTVEGRALLNSRSPLNLVERIKRPLLIGQGANDPRVKQAESDQIVRAMNERKISVTYVLFPDEGHGFARPVNNKAFFAVTEAFLAQHLGGQAEPIGDDLDGSSITVPNGADHVQGLTEVLSKRHQ
ncbi:MAG: Dipeptidyl aminopeptidase BIII [Phycisphaerae bacterium]|nr:Dipeptidyl aminopeptidase BIII [Phycisphaerae bacterium]